MVSRATPRTCANFNAVFAFTAWKTPSTAANSGACSRIKLRSPVAISSSRLSKGDRGLVRITPAATIRCRPPSLSITPQPVFSEPQSTPRTRTLLRQRLQLLLVDIEVGINALHVVVVFQEFRQPEHAAGVLAFQLHEVLRNPGDGRVHRLNAR